MEKDIRFTEKKVDESWKEQIQRDTLKDLKTSSSSQKSTPNTNPSPKESNSNKTSPAFMNLISSLGFQAMMNLGELPSPDGIAQPANLEAAKELIDILVALRQKSTSNLSAEEEGNLTALVAELQMKFSQKI